MTSPSTSWRTCWPNCCRTTLTGTLPGRKPFRRTVRLILLQPFVHGLFDLFGRNLNFHPALEGAGRLY